MFSVRRTRAGLFLAAILAVLHGCTDADPLAAPASAPDAARASADLVARGIARALAMPDLRQRLLADFRDSPFARNKIHLTSYLAGDDGAALAAAAAEGAGVSPADFAATLRALPPLAIYLPRTNDRILWAGDDRLVVAASLEDGHEFAAATSRTGYGTLGRPMRYDPRSRQAFVVILIRPAGDEFGADPEAARRAAGTREGGTITTPTGPARLIGDNGTGTIGDGGCGMYARDCPVTGGGGGGTATGLTLPAGVNLAACRAAPTDDRDLDYISDACEYQIAYAFRPSMIMDRDDDAPGREPYWVLRGAGRDSVMVAYLLSYYEDTGVGTFEITAHQGDSEFIILTLRNIAGTTRWQLEHAVLSAHWGKDTDATYDGGYENLQYPYAYRGRPQIWVAQDKHANYRTRNECRLGAWGFDRCEAPLPNEDLQVLPSRNIGSDHSKLVTCVTSVGGSAWRTGQECYFDGSIFAGWAPSPTRDSNHAGPYRDVLMTWYFMPRPGGAPFDPGSCGPYAKACY